jgi:hypothetical protein
MMRLYQTAKLQTRSALAVSICAIALAWLLTLATFEIVHVRHAPNRYDRRADRETRIPYSRSPAQPNPRRTIVIHSAPNTPEAPAAASGDQATESEPTDSAPAD